MRQPVVYNHTVKAFIEHILEARGLLDSTLNEQLIALGVNVRRPADLELAVWWKMVELTASLLAPSRPNLDPMELVGREMLAGFSHTFLGKSAFMVLRMLGPRRGLARLAEQFRLADSVTQITSRELAPNCIELTYRVTGGIPFPNYIRGLLLEGMLRVGAHAPTVISKPLSTDTFSFTVSWQNS